MYSYLTVSCLLFNLIITSHSQSNCKNDELCLKTANNGDIVFKSSNVIVNNQSVDLLGDLTKTSIDELRRNIEAGAASLKSNIDLVGLQLTALSALVPDITELGDTLQKINSTFDTYFGSGTFAVSPSRVRRGVLLIRRTRRQFRAFQRKLLRDDCANNTCKNGGKCYDLFDDYVCSCPSGWQGKNCDIDVDECELFAGTDLGCKNGGQCVNTNGSFVCNCTSDFRGKHCTTRDTTCDATSNAELCDHGTCIDVTRPIVGQPNYWCHCEQGWTTDGKNGSACNVDINECEQWKAPCSTIPRVECFNYPGGFHCATCPLGFNGDGFYCADVNECLLDNGGCSTAPTVECTNTFGSRVCGPCPPGYSGDGVTCDQVTLCSTNNGGCNSLATCVESAGYVSCICPNGYVGDGFGVFGCNESDALTLCKSNPCGNRGKCVPVGNETYNCECFYGYEGSLCELNATTCNSNPCKNGATCVDGVNSFQCICAVNWQGDLCDEMRDECGGSFSSTFGYIKYPISNNTAIVGNNNKARSCEWFISTSEGKVLNLQFSLFNINSAADCSNNFVKIYDGPNRNSPSLGKYCGSIDRLPNNGNISSNTESATIWFKTDSMQSNDVFELQWYTTNHTCGGTIERSHDSIRYPLKGQYLPNRDCYWLIKVPMSMKIKIHITDMSIEEHPDCSYDYVNIYDGELTTDPILATYCTSITSITPFTTLSSRALIHFHSDGVSKDRGFYLSFTSEAAVADCGGNFTREKGIVRSPRFPLDKRQQLVCEYLITVNKDKSISLTFTEFAVTQIFYYYCRTDSVEVYDGTSEKSPRFGRYCSPRPPPRIIRSSSNSLFIRFKSSYNTTGKGFIASYESTCGGYFTATTGELRSPNYPAVYPSDKSCIYHIVAPPSSIIQLKFIDFELQDNCDADFVEVKEGEHENATLINRYCGSELPGLITSTFNELWLLFKSDAQYNYRGFYANYTTLYVGCGGIKKGVQGSWVGVYRNTIGEQCNWLLVAPAGHFIQIYYIRIKIEGTPGNCNASFLELKDSDGSVLGRFCGNRAPAVLQSTGEMLTVLFQRRQGVNDSFSTFNLSYKVLNASTVCGGTITEKSGFIRTPNYPQNYPKYTTCIWVIQVERGHQIALEVKSFNLSSPNSRCYGSYLIIRNGQFRDSPLIGRYCLENIPVYTVSHSNSLYLQFRSSRITAPGFEISYSSIVSGCGGTVTRLSGIIESPDYPYPYNHKAVCEWIIHVSHGSSVTIYLVDVHLEEHDACTLDSLEIFDGPDDRSKRLIRICDASSNLTVTSSSNVVLVKFRSDVSVSRRGFQLSYKTNCSRTITGPSGIIESPNFPGVPNSEYNCSWYIEAPIGNHIRMVFSHLNVSESADCSQSFVDVRQFKDNGSGFKFRSMSKICQFKFGTPLPGVFEIESNKALVNFVHMKRIFMIYRRSFSSPRPRVIRVGPFAPAYFRLEWHAVGCSMDFVDKDRGYFQSPNYPNPYMNETECLWRIRGTDKIVQLHFIYPKPRESMNCVTNYIKVFAGPDTTSPLLSTLCGEETRRAQLNFNSTGRDLSIYYKTDGSFAINFYGFFELKAPTSKVCGGRYENLNEGNIISRSYSTLFQLDDPTKDDCVWHIRVPEMHVVELNISRFQFENKGKCENASLTFYDSYYIPEDNRSTLLQICDNKSLPIVRSIRNVMSGRLKIFLHGGGEGFQASFKSVCGGVKIISGNDKSEYTLTSSNYPLKSSKNRYCNWTLQAEDPEQKILFRITRIEAVEAYNCSVNYIEVREGDTGEGPVIGKYCGKQAPSQIISQGNALHVYLHSNAIFRALYTTEISSCGGYLDGDKGYFSSPGYPNNYPLDTDCVWYLRASVGNRVSLTFTDFEMKNTEFCNTDYVEVRDTYRDGALFGRYCGGNIPLLQSNVTSNQLWVRFLSDGIGTSKGFMAFYTLLHGADISSDYGSIMSPRFPETYTTTDGRIVWTVTTPIGTGIMVNIYNMEIPYPTNSKECLNYLEISMGVGEDALLIDRYCGFTNPDTVPIHSNVISIAYYSTKPGRFNLYFRSNATLLQTKPKDRSNKTCPYTKLTPVNNSSDIMELQSPGYPSGYPANLNCSWEISTVAGYHYEVDVIEIELDSYHCIKVYEPLDYLSLTWKLNYTLCGRNKQTLLSSTNRLKIDFITDSYNSPFRGFKLQFKRVCGGFIYDTSGELSSETVRSKTYCEWNVQVRPGRKIDVTLKVNSSSQSCEKASIVLRNGESNKSPLLSDGNYCDYQAHSLQTYSNHLFVTFGAPLEAVVYFSLQFQENSTTCGGSVELNAIKNSMKILSPTTDQEDIECVWVIRSPANTNIRINFDLSPEALSCNFQDAFIELRDGGTIVSRVIRNKICVPINHHSELSFPSSNNMMFVRFVTKKSQSTRFSATVSIDTCGGSYQLRYQSLIIKNPDYAKAKLQVIECQWLINVPMYDSVINITIVNYTIKSDVADCDSTSFLYVREDSDGGPFLGRYCNNSNLDLIAPPRLTSTGPRVYIHFKTNSASDHFYLMVTQWHSPCGGYINPAITGEITSPGFPNSFPYARDCRFTLRAPADRRIKLTFESFNLKSIPRMPEKCLDEMWISKSPVMTDKPREELVQCTNVAPDPIESLTMGMTIRFSTKSLAANEGFRAKYSTDDEILCGGKLSTTDQEVTSYRFNDMTFKEDFTCLWTVDKDEFFLNRTTSISFQVFDISNENFTTGESNACNGGFLGFGDGNRGYGLRMHWNKYICGNRTAVDYFYIFDTSMEESFMFLSMNYSMGNKGIKAKYTVQECGGYFTSFPMIIQSSGFASSTYPPNSTCLWRLNGRTNLQIHFDTFELEKSDGCKKDYLEIIVGSYRDSPALDRLCGNDSSSFPPVKSYSFQFLFKSDSSGTGKGFKISVEPTSSVCGGVYQYDTGGIPFSYGKYKKDMECEWIVKVNPSYHLSFSFSGAFSIEQSDGCTNDYVFIEQWISGRWSIVNGTFCGHTLPTGAIVTKTNKARVIFRSDHNDLTGEGFYLRYTVACGDIFSDDSGVITSPGYPDKYKQNLNCQYLIEASDTDYISLTFDEFDVEVEVRNCTWDSIIIFKGNTTAAPALGPYCGDLTTAPPKLLNKGSVLIMFTTDSAIAKKGFKASYHRVSCGGSLTSSLGEIRSPNDGDKYLPNMYCVWRITVDEKRVIAFRFNELNMDCYGDKVYIYDSPNITDTSKLGSFCYSRSSQPLTIKSTGNAMTIVFRSDEAFELKGFQATYTTTLGEKQGCGGLIQGSSGVLNLPTGEKGIYENMLDCVWTLQTPDDTVVNITFEMMDIEFGYVNSSAKCNYDYLEIRDGDKISNSLVDHFCGNSTPDAMVFSTNNLLIQFHSDFSISAKGFRLRYSAVESSCGLTITATKSRETLSSPNYPSPYPSGIRCAYILKLNESDASVSVFSTPVQIKFIDLNISCELSDYIEVMSVPLSQYVGSGFVLVDRRLCTSIDYSAVLYTPLRITLHSSGNNGTRGRGFKLEYNVLSCPISFNEKSGYLAYTGRNESCTVSISAPVGTKVAVYFSYLHIHDVSNYGANCSQVNMTAIEAFTEKYAIKKTLLTTCEHYGVDYTPLFSSTNEVQLQFSKSNFDFNLIYTSSAVSGCGGEIIADYGMLTSPAFPNAFSEDATCIWTITNLAGHTFYADLHFVDFNSTDDCDSNYVELYDGLAVIEANRVGRYCGQARAAPLRESAKNEFALKMVTDRNNTGKGFVLRFYSNVQPATSRHEVRTLNDRPHNFDNHRQGY